MNRRPQFHPQLFITPLVYLQVQHEEIASRLQTNSLSKKSHSSSPTSPPLEHLFSSPHLTPSHCTRKAVCRRAVWHPPPPSALKIIQYKHSSLSGVDKGSLDSDSAARTPHLRHRCVFRDASATSFYPSFFSPMSFIVVEMPVQRAMWPCEQCAERINSPCLCFFLGLTPLVKEAPTTLLPNVRSRWSRGLRRAAEASLFAL